MIKLRILIFAGVFGVSCLFQFRIQVLERFSYDLEKWKREQNRNNKRPEIEPFDWFIERIQTRVAFGWLSERPRVKKLHARELLESIDTSLWRHTATDWSIEQCLLHIRVFFGGKTKRPCFVPLADKTNNEHLPKPFFKVIRKSLYDMWVSWRHTYQNDLTQVIFTRHRTNFDRLSICEFRCCVHTEPP